MCIRSKIKERKQLLTTHYLDLVPSSYMVRDYITNEWHSQRPRWLHYTSLSLLIMRCIMVLKPKSFKQVLHAKSYKPDILASSSRKGDIGPVWKEYLNIVFCFAIHKIVGPTLEFVVWLIFSKCNFQKTISYFPCLE